MNHYAISSWLAAAYLTVSAFVAPANAQILPPDRLLADALTSAADGKDPIPGPRTCFWARGPASGDPYINVAYPDTATFYWAAVFTVPAGAKLTLEGSFPHSRYMSLISYDEAGRPIESVADYLVAPSAGSTNPFLSGADRQATQRNYSMEIVDGRPDARHQSGMNLQGRTATGCTRRSTVPHLVNRRCSIASTLATRAPTKPAMPACRRRC